MGLAVDSIGLYAANPGASGAAPTVNSGDSLTIRAYTPSAYAGLENIYKQGATEGFIQVRSPLLHDNVRGIRFTPSETPTALLEPAWPSEIVKPMDTLSVLLAGGTAETDAAVIAVGYDDLPGAAARLHSWGDIAGLIQHIKPVEVDLTTSGTAGTWNDTVVTITEDLMEANRDYAVLGYISDTALCAIGVKGAETGNLRVTGPGIIRVEVSAQFFVKWSNLSGRPRIPVFNSANRYAFYLSTLNAAASSTVKVQLVLALLSQNLSS
jgi:hypothetical protein